MYHQQDVYDLSTYDSLDKVNISTANFRKEGLENSDHNYIYEEVQAWRILTFIDGENKNERFIL